ncbi:hypothetical protein [Mucilaginibacter ginkgonis]|uniref:Uncharacterized protein n=1 Tax=Mucilaginibacter ginkgonis TaxID=2682091 RepID=A0A6I4I3V9_9SPHI|nr:hypothetical protein [Mucilaginibacter ginkgonis]QQL48745.1 hypothetical protein GO620_011200 [Mucilaginibacter ginkgonis]
MSPISPWLQNANKKLREAAYKNVNFITANGYSFNTVLADDSCWLMVTWPKGARIAFRLAYGPSDILSVKSIKEKDGGIDIDLESNSGLYQITIEFPSADQPVLHHTTTFKPAEDLLIPFWPRDIIALGNNAKENFADGEVYVQQVGGRSGQLYFSLKGKNGGSVMYLQNLTALADYNQDTETSAMDTVGGEWPEIGFALPPTIKGKPMQAGKTYTISNAFIAFAENAPKTEAEISTQYLDMLAAAYLAMPKPDPQYINWPEVLEKGLYDLIDSPGCWAQVGGNHYFNAYVADYDTPPEVMVQLAVMLPLLDYVEWSGQSLEVIDKVREGLPAFYDEKYNTIMRWHPKVADQLDGAEEQKQPLVMDAWYLHHPLLNLSRLALKGDKVAKKLFLDSLEFSIKVAHHFNYTWPVFYKIDTLEVVKAETQPGKGGEKDVPGLYAHVMLQAWELTGDKRYLNEAEKSARHLQGLGFELFYQANNTAFTTGAMLRLYKETKKDIYLDLCHLCIANIFKNVKLWDCNYGYGKHFSSFFALYPLSDAPYTAVYEEQEIFCALHDLLHLAEDVDILPSARLLIAEYIRFITARAAYYYPTMLPKEMLEEKPKTGEVDHNLWIALEDLHDGWEKSGSVGQEVYGAGNAFGILPRHYMRVPGDHFMIFTDYPSYNFSAKKSSPAHLRLAGDGRLNCRIMLIKTDKTKLPEVRVLANRKEVACKKVEGGNLEYTVPGDAQVSITWNS